MEDIAKEEKMREVIEVEDRDLLITGEGLEKMTVVEENQGEMIGVNVIQEIVQIRGKLEVLADAYARVPPEIEII